MKINFSGNHNDSFNKNSKESSGIRGNPGENKDSSRRNGRFLYMSLDNLKPYHFNQPLNKGPNIKLPIFKEGNNTKLFFKTFKNLFQNFNDKEKDKLSNYIN